LTAADALERHVVGDNTDRLYAHRVVTAAGTVGRFIFEGDAKQCAALPALIAALEARVARGHNDTCGAVLSLEPYPCSCGHDQCVAALEKARGR
jgi:hypothetical protein